MRFCGKKRSCIGNLLESRNVASVYIWRCIWQCLDKGSDFSDSDFRLFKLSFRILKILITVSLQCMFILLWENHYNCKTNLKYCMYYQILSNNSYKAKVLHILTKKYWHCVPIAGQALWARASDVTADVRGGSRGSHQRAASAGGASGDPARVRPEAGLQEDQSWAGETENVCWRKIRNSIN